MSDINPLDEVPGPELAGPRDLTSGPIVRTLVSFSIPTLGANLLQALGMTINTIWVGQLLGESALAATANANMIMFLCFAAVFGFSMATTVRLGQSAGARDADGVRRAFGTGTGFSAGIAIVGSVLGWIFARDLLHLLATPPAIRDLALTYLRVSFIAMPFSTVMIMIAMSLRGAGDARTPLYAMLLTTLAGSILNPLLILGIGPFPQLGIGGSALALALGNLLGAAAMIAWIYWKDLPLRLRGAELSYLLTKRDELSYIVVKGVPMGAQMFIGSTASLILIGLVNREGVATTAAYGAIIQLWNYIQMPSFAISSAVSAMVAQNVGAGLHGRVERINSAGLVTTGLITTVLFLVLLAVDGPVLDLFLGQGSTAGPVAEHIELLATWSWILMGLVMVLSGTMRAYGVVILPLVIMSVALYPARLGFYFVFYPLIGADALWLAYGFGSAVALVLTILLYRYGSWRKAHGLDRPAGEPA